MPKRSTEPEKKAKKTNGIKRLRKYLGKPRPDFAHMLNVSLAALKSWELGIYEPREEGWRRLRVVCIRISMEELGMSKADASRFVDQRLYPAD